ncbi:hypothetical protein ACTXT7_010619 [Hymenolepis weldensis]
MLRFVPQVKSIPFATIPDTRVAFCQFWYIIIQKKNFKSSSYVCTPMPIGDIKDYDFDNHRLHPLNGMSIATFEL